jgi:3-oxoacyl-[acyl-carrier-protein] synthase-3
MSKVHAAITAVNAFVPEYILTNKELEGMVETNDEWITSRTGIKERRILKGDLGTSDMATHAVNGLLEKRGISATEIDLIIFCTTTPDMVFPASANILAHKIGAVNAWGYDLNAACSGFLYGQPTKSTIIMLTKKRR